MLKKSISLLAGILILQLTYSCEQKTDSPDSLDALNATLWMQKSAEYKANCLQAYYLAGNQLQIAMDDKNWTAALEQHGDYTGLPPAIILDIDETVLDNSPYESRLIRNGENYSDKTWDQWCREANAEPVPGALEFCKK
ncbi:MAG: HAD family acid phosphatase, partial [Calditrichaceae bacterium]